MKWVLASRQDPYSHADGWGDEDPLGFQLDMIAQHELLGVRMQVHLLVQPLRHRMPIQVMLEPVRSYVSGTIDSFERYRLTAFRDSVLQFTVE